LAEVREEQADLAQRAGIEAFCYWHYWFGNGRRILERPFSEVLTSGSPGISFCLGWANETWTGIWHGATDRILAAQTYPGDEDDRRHFEAIVPAFRDDRYLKVDGRPVFYVYKPAQLPDAAKFVDDWQAMAVRAGLPGLYLVAGLGSEYRRFAEDGFDGGFFTRLPYVRPKGRQLKTRFRRKVLHHPLVRPFAAEPLVPEMPAPPDARLFPCVIPNWDNTPRSGRNGVVLTGSTPERFRTHVRRAKEVLETYPPGERLLWLKSWNEWAEGNYLEPDLEYGNARLDVLRDELVGR